MSGESKKKRGVNPGIEFFYILSRMEEFQEDLIRARRQLGIPKKGFFKKETQKLWVDTNLENMIDLLGIELKFKEKYKIPVPYYDLIDEYIFFGKPIHNFIKSPVALLRPTKELEEMYKSIGEPFTTILVFQNATKQTLKEFMHKNWKEIEIEIKAGKRTKTTIFKERNQVIRDLWKLPLKDLQWEADSKSAVRDILISKILVKRGLTSRELSGGYIRKEAHKK